MCSNTLATAGSISVREYGLPSSETLVQLEVISTVWVDTVGDGVETIIDYFQGFNAQNLSMLDARTTPITVRSKNNETWLVGMMVSTAHYPDNSTIPAPYLPLKFENVGKRLLAVTHFQTAFFPQPEDFQTECDIITAGPLPSGYVIDTESSWSPTFVIYNGEVSNNGYWSECWIEVKKV